MRVAIIKGLGMFALAYGLVACGSGEDSTATNAPHAAGGQSGSAGLGGEWAGGSAGTAGDPGSGGVAGTPNTELDASTGSGGSAGEPTGGAGGESGSPSDGGSGNSDSGSGGKDAGGFGGKGGTGGGGGSGGGFGIDGGIVAPGGGGSGGSGGGVVLSLFTASVTSATLSANCELPLLAGSFNAHYYSLYSSPTTATITSARVDLTKTGKAGATYAFDVSPTSSGALLGGQSKNVKHSVVPGGVGALCGYCDGKATLVVDWVLSNGNKRTDSYGPFTLSCSGSAG